jgi:glycine/D-amino acid oxidase-like deaminating enzyme
MTRDSALTEDFKNISFWRDRSPPSPGEQSLPSERVDVVVIGAGYSGLFTALALARGGRSVLVLEADTAGEHASTKNFGAIGRTIRLSFSELREKYDLKTAVRIFEEAKAWVEFTASFVERENLDCGFVRHGRTVSAHTPQSYESMARELELAKRFIETDTHMVPRHEQHTELGTDIYHGCAVLNDVGHLDPGRYHQGVLTLVREAGVRVVDRTRAIDVQRSTGGHTVLTSRGTVETREVVLATNAETGKDNGLFRYFRRRVVPVSVYSAVTEPLPPELLRSVFPHGRTMLETRRLYMGLRPIESEGRLLAVGRHMRPYRHLQLAGAALKKDLVGRYPQLTDCRFSHIWQGRFAITFDWLPHLGTHDGVHYLLGLNGAGVPAAGYLGHKLAQRILGTPNRDTVFADRPYPSFPGYTGSSWFLPALGTAYRYADDREARRAK